MNTARVQVGQTPCGCGTKHAPTVWCYIHGYLIKPPVIKRTKRRQHVTK